MNMFQSLCMKLASIVRRSRHRIALYNKAGMNIDNDCFVNSFSATTNEITIGPKSYVNRNCRFEGAQMKGRVSIGSNVCVGFGVSFCTVSHHVGDHERRAGDFYVADIVVGNGCWIGANATILPGVTIGDGCVIAAGAVVNGDCEPDGLYAGVPARLVKRL